MNRSKTNRTEKIERRDFLNRSASAAAVASLAGWGKLALADHSEHATCHLTYATPADAMKAPAETIAYIPCIRTSTGIAKPDFLN